MKAETNETAPQCKSLYEMDELKKSLRLMLNAYLIHQPDTETEDREEVYCHYESIDAILNVTKTMEG